MTRWGLAGLLVITFGFYGCGDRLAEIQTQLAGTWVLASRKMDDGTVLRPPHVQGAMSWVPINSRKAHVSLDMLEAADGDLPRRFNYAASVYEISTSAITRGRYMLIRQGFRSSAEAPFSIYDKDKKTKGKITVGEKKIEISNDDERWVFQGNTLTTSYENAWTDTWMRVQ